MIKKYNLHKYLFFSGPAYSPTYTCLNKKEKNSLELRTLFIQEMAKHRVLINYISLSYSHGKNELNITLKALDKTLKIYKKALKYGVEKFLDGNSIKPVFRRYN